MRIWKSVKCDFLLVVMNVVMVLVIKSLTTTVENAHASVKVGIMKVLLIFQEMQLI